MGFWKSLARILVFDIQTCEDCDADYSLYEANEENHGVCKKCGGNLFSRDKRDGSLL